MFPICWGLFAQAIAEARWKKQADWSGASEAGESTSIEIPDDYVKEERGRTGRSVLMAMEPELATTVLSEDGP